MSFFGAQPVVQVEPKDIEVTNLPNDSISALAFSPTQDLLAIASWSNEVSLTLSLFRSTAHPIAKRYASYLCVPYRSTLEVLRQPEEVERT